MAFFRGQKVTTVCEWPPVDYEVPRHGVVYTIREIIEGTRDDGVGTGLRFVEIVNHQKLCQMKDGGSRMSEYAFAAEYFRPVTDISLLQSIVTDVMVGNFRQIAPDKFDPKPAKNKIISGLQEAIRHARGHR